MHQAEVMIASVRVQHPDLKISIIVPDIDSKTEQLLQRAIGSDVELLNPADLGFGNLALLKKFYNALEYCSAMKVVGMQYFLRNGEDVLFLDPDVLVIHSLDKGLFDLSGDVLLSPHSLEPYPNDANVPSDLEIIRSGHINGGVILVRNSEGGREAIDWLSKKITFQWFVSPKSGFYADQLWISALPYFFRNKVELIEDKGINVAYWNLHERNIECDKNNILRLGNGSPVKLLHLSGFDPSGKNISKHTTREFGAVTELALTQILKSYRNDLIQAQRQYSHISSNFTFSNAPLFIRMNRSKWRNRFLNH